MFTRLPEQSTRETLLSVLTSGLVEPAPCDAVLDALRSAKEPGLTDHLSSLDYAPIGATTLTHCQRL